MKTRLLKKIRKRYIIVHTNGDRSYILNRRKNTLEFESYHGEEIMHHLAKEMGLEVKYIKKIRKRNDWLSYYRIVNRIMN